MNDAAFAALREDNDRLRAENAWLRELYCPPPDVLFINAAQRKLRVMPQVAQLLWIFWDCRMKSREGVANSLWNDPDAHSTKSIEVQLCRLRKALDDIDAGIETIWGHGWRLSREDRARIAEVIGVEVPA